MNDPEVYMQRCLDLALKGKAHAAPNPMVGAVLVHQGRIIGEGWHPAYGKEHAEVAAFNNVLPHDRNLIPESTLYVNLEPCAHHGKTPPCADRIVAEQVKEVVVCNKDPFDQVAGKGFGVLRNHNIPYTIGLLEHQGRWLNRRFFCFHENKRPYIILKWAQTKDGYFAPLSRSRYQISNRHSQQLLHRWRTEESAIIVGTRTAQYDDPLLTSRLWQGPNPLRIVLDRKLTLPRTLAVFNEDAPTWVVNELSDTSEKNITNVRLPFNEGMLHALCDELYMEGRLSLIVEGGASLLNSFIKAGWWDESRVFIGDCYLGQGIPAPLLKNSVPAFSVQMDSDTLQVSTNANTDYPYAPGMQL